MAAAYDLYVVTGAPGAGKSTTVAACLALSRRYLVFDIDWLAPAASRLAGKSIYTEPSTWPAYGEVWFEVLHSIHRNGRTPIFFTPGDPNDFAGSPLPPWCAGLHWLLLDCADDLRRQRLAARPGWTAGMIDAALVDARLLRDLVATRVDTGRLAPGAVAEAVLRWVDLHVAAFNTPESGRKSGS